MDKHCTVYISGPITGVKDYWQAFEAADDKLSSRGFAVLNPARLPKGMTDEQYMRIDLAMIDAADAVYFLKGWENSRGARIEHSYCDYTNKPRRYEANERN